MAIVARKSRPENAFEEYMSRLKWFFINDCVASYQNYIVFIKISAALPSAILLRVMREGESKEGSSQFDRTLRYIRDHAEPTKLILTLINLTRQNTLFLTCLLILMICPLLNARHS